MNEISVVHLKRKQRRIHRYLCHIIYLKPFSCSRVIVMAVIIMPVMVIITPSNPGTMLKNTEFETISRQKKISFNTNLSKDIYDVALALLKEHWDIKIPIRLLTVTVADLTKEKDYIQLTLFDNDRSQQDLEKTIDDIRNAYGSDSITYGSIIDNDLGVSTNYHLLEEDDDDR